GLCSAHCCSWRFLRELVGDSTSRPTTSSRGSERSQTNKSDFLAETIAGAVQRPRMRFVPTETEEQLELQALHRVCKRWVMRRTAVVNPSASPMLSKPDPVGYFLE